MQVEERMDAFQTKSLNLHNKMNKMGTKLRGIEKSNFKILASMKRSPKMKNPAFDRLTKIEERIQEKLEKINFTKQQMI